MSYRRILVPLDGSATSKKALAAALEMARENKGRVRLAHAIDELALVSSIEYAGHAMKAALDYGAKVLHRPPAARQRGGIRHPAGAAAGAGRAHRRGPFGRGLKVRRAPRFR